MVIIRNFQATPNLAKYHIIPLELLNSITIPILYPISTEISSCLESIIQRDH